MHLKRLVIAALVFVLMLAGCSGNGATTEQPTPTPSEQPAVEPVDGEEDDKEEEPPFRQLFTGLPADEERPERAVAVMVENQAHARPQSGLDQADVIYEILAEGDITRFVAVFQSKAPEIVGPVRSIRPYYIAIGEALDAIIVHAGWSPEAQRILTQEKKLPYINEITGNSEYFWRSKERKAPHNLYTSMELIRKAAEARKFSDTWQYKPLAFYGKDEQPDGADAKTVSIQYIGTYSVSYTYDETSGTYLRSMDGEPHNDKETGVRLAAANIIVGKTEHRILDSVGRRAVNVKGPGEGFLIQGGKMKPVTWELKDGLVRAYVDGVEQKLVPGQTWIQLVPMQADVKIEQAVQGAS